MARSAGVVDGSDISPPHSFNGIKKNHFDFATTPALRATPPAPGGELFLPVLQFIHMLVDRAHSLQGFRAFSNSCIAALVGASPAMFIPIGIP